MSAAPSSRPGIFLVGTDTGVGKTTVGRALLRHASRRGYRLVPFKPVETGCEGSAPPDATSLVEAASIPGLSVTEVCRYPFSAPLSPSVAARLEGATIEAAEIVTRANMLARHADALLVEGAGGLLSPWGPDLNAATLASTLGLPVAIIAANRLGTINHTALVAEACVRRGLRCVGFVLVNATPVATLDRASNATEIARETGLPSLGILSYLPNADSDTLATRARSELDLGTLLGVDLG